MLGITNVSNAPSVVLSNTTISTWTALPSTGTDSDMKTQGYTYYASIPCNGISANTIAEVTFSEANAKSGNYASTCRTYADEIRVYSKVNTAITIPSIIVHSIVETYYTVDNSPPTSGKTTAITSGAVYDALKPVEITGLTFTDVTGNIKAYRSGNIVQICLAGASITASNETYIVSGLPKAKYNSAMYLVDWSSGTHAGLLSMMTGGTQLRRYGSGNVGNIWITFTYMVDVD